RTRRAADLGQATDQTGAEDGVAGEGEVDAEVPQFGAVDRGDGHVELHLADAADGERVDDGRRAAGAGALAASRHAADQDALRDAQDGLDLLGVRDVADQDDGVGAGGDRLDLGGREGALQHGLDDVDVELDDDLDALLDALGVRERDEGGAG